MSEKHLFTSESVTEGHPDKVADQISDSIVDAILSADPKGRVACETLVTTGMALVAGEITKWQHRDRIGRGLSKRINDKRVGPGRGELAHRLVGDRHQNHQQQAENQIVVSGKASGRGLADTKAGRALDAVCGDLVAPAEEQRGGLNGQRRLPEIWS